MARAVTPKTVIAYADRAGREPFTAWLRKLKDAEGRARIMARLRRVEQGHYGDCRHIRDGVYELRLFFGPGYRVYFGEDGDRLVVLLCGGGKDTQKKDIGAALALWKEYQER